MFTLDNPPPEPQQPGDPIYQLVTAEIAAAQGYPESLVGFYVIVGRLPAPDSPA